jgi:hypothetical protein
MRNTYFSWVVLCASMATLGCRTPSSDWNGAWKLDPAKSSYQGQVLVISITADGDYRYDEGNWSFTFPCDGKERPVGDNRTRVCVRTGVTALDITQKENGVKTRSTHDELSTDGKVFTTTVTEFRASGPIITHQTTFSRLSGSSDFTGQWRDTSYLHQHADMTLRLDNQAVHISYPNAGQHIDAPFDGVDAAVHGPNPDGMTYTARLVGRREFLYVTKRNDKVLSQGSLKLSYDGRAIIDSWSNPDRPNDKGSLVYEKK